MVAADERQALAVCSAGGMSGWIGKVVGGIGTVVGRIKGVESRAQAGGSGVSVSLIVAGMMMAGKTMLMFLDI